MQEQQAVLDFFAQPQNLSLGLAVAELMDTRREQLNSQFWRDVQNHFQRLIEQAQLPWKIQLTEDRNAPDSLVGLHGEPMETATQYLHPMFEQQNMGKGQRIYIGLMWRTDPTPEQLALPAVITLKTALDAQGFKQNERFLAWQWTSFYPRRHDFLLRYTQHPTALMEELTPIFTRLMVTQHPFIDAANTALAKLPRSSNISFQAKMKIS
jgi:hypothetical protein